MKRLLLLSGKGGTGKTTVSAALVRLSQAQAVADCDVDAPNLHLLLAQNTAPEVYDFMGGDKAQVDAALCTGCGASQEHCRFDAIHVVDGVAKVDPEKCTGCLQCAAVCPRKVIVPVSYDADIVIACSNHERGAYTRRECDMGCVGCHLCEKQCEFDAIHVVNNLAVIDYSKCVSCGRCAAVCPRKLISDSNLRQDMDAVPAMPR